MSPTSLYGPRVRPRGPLRPLARLLTACAAAGSLLFAAAPAQAAGSTSSDAFYNMGSTSRADWMRSLAGTTSLASVSMPGTHDTLAIHGGQFVETQADHGDSAQTLSVQLDRGIRAIDIRVRVTENQYFTVHHAAYYQQANFDDVLSKAKAFLTAHKDETIVMRLKAECPQSGGGIADCKNDPSNVSSERIATIFDLYAKKYDGLFYKPSIERNSTGAVPTLSQARGKIVLGAFDSVGYSYGTSGFNSNTEDHWKAPGPEEKFDYVRANLERAVKGSASAMYVTYSSASTVPTYYPEEFAAGFGRWMGREYVWTEGVNSRLMRYLNDGGGNGRIGIVMMDFPGWALLENIIARNVGNMIKGSHPAIWLVNDNKTYVNSKYNRCMVRGPEFDSSKTGGLVTQRACQPTPPVSHQWGVAQPTSFDAKGYYWIKSSNGSCLTVPYNNGTPPPAGTQLYWWGCETRWFSGNQMWNVIPMEVGFVGTSRTAYAFINQWTGQCLAIDPATATVAGGKVTQDVCPK
ncbi:phosphatidylinositol-specific phospholipase C domain-containing protein [Streptomyces termitum]|uniref:1-phosphatidylinositol phosphodiesterase n=1 Tax=Streptomyces termitum TaxID=67368 RepID=A0A918SPD3_9ACTN|nr:phosphatidylinositol-specific phospholipase C domain-containing protein [Streptomyces termitum]GHA63668.1 hypothetical protein GCM10010305_01340 [Streptomyces termitum]